MYTEANPMPVSLGAGSVSITATGFSTETSLVETHGTKAPGVAALKSVLMGGVYTSAGITLTNGQQAAFQMDSTGALRVTGAGGGGAGQQYAEDAAHVNGDLGTMALAVRKDTAAALSGADGDYTPLITDAQGRLWVTIGAGFSSQQYAEDAAHVTADLGTMALAVRKDTATALASPDGDYSPLITDVSGRLHVNVGAAVLPANAALETTQAETHGVVAPGTAATKSNLAGAVFTTGGVTLTNGQQAALQMDSTGALRVTGGNGGQQYAEDAAHTSGDLGNMALVVRKDAATQLASADGDYAPMEVDASGRLWVNVGVSALPAGAASETTQAETHGSKAPGTAAANSNLTGGVYTAAGVTLTTGQQAALQLDATGSLKVAGTFAGSQQYAEDSQHVSADLGTMNLAVRRDTASSLVSTDGDYIPLSTDSAGRLWVNVGAGVVNQQYAEDAPHISADLGTMALVVRKDTAASLAGSDGDYTALEVDASGRLHVNIGTSVLPTGAATSAIQSETHGTKAPGAAAANSDLIGGVYNSAGVTLTNGQQAALQMDAAGAIKVSGAGGGQQYAEDAAHVSADLGTMALTVRKDTATALAGTDGDYAPLEVDASGRLHVAMSGVDFTSGTAGVNAGGVSSVQGFGYDVVASITRPANTTTYTARDVVGGAITFTGLAPAAATILLTGSQFELDIATIPSGMTSFTLYLYNVTPPSAVADNAAFDLASGDRASYLGKVDLGTPIDEGGTCYIETSFTKQIKTASANVFGYLVTTGGYIPAANSEVYKITMHAVGV